MARVSKQIIMLNKLKELQIDLESQILDKNAQMSVFNSIKDCGPCFEDCQSLFERGLKIKNFFNQFIKNYDLKDDEKVIVVCHSMTIASITAKSVDDT